MFYTRRSFLKLSGILALPWAAGLRPAYSKDQDAYADLAATDKWMKLWMKAPHASSGPLRVGRFADPMYFLTAKIGWAPNAGQDNHKPVKVPVGFVTDFASIPRIFWSMLPTDGLYTFPAIVHDYLYWEQPIERGEADEIFRLALQDFKINAATIIALYEAVTLGGKSAWDENARLKRAGEKRILKIAPTDPTIRWIDWKSKPGVL